MIENVLYCFVGIGWFGCLILTGYFNEDEQDG